ncbi:hypothetical protein [Rhizobium favelukesii]|uniref:hypothetical protein n=1 Tax=Rhizobium favelukesii TaxID=348824 RepID=UPI001FD87CA4|nr:hypothetical protein [Rhizobium favelukesii]
MEKMADRGSAYRLPAATYAQLARFEDARRAASELLKLNPEFSIDRFSSRAPIGTRLSLPDTSKGCGLRVCRSERPVIGRSTTLQQMTSGFDGLHLVGDHARSRFEILRSTFATGSKCSQPARHALVGDNFASAQGGRLVRKQKDRLMSFLTEVDLTDEQLDTVTSAI